MAIALAAACAVFCVGGCSRQDPKGWQGYIEGEFVYVASPLSGRLEKLSVSRGAQVVRGTPLFTLESAAETADLRRVTQQLEAARADLEDLKKGSRPEELAALEAKLGESRAAEENSRLEAGRQEALFRTGAVSASDYDRARLAHESDLRAVDEAAAKLASARLGGRADAVAAAEASVRAAEDSEARARWSVEQKAQSAVAPALVYDTLYREGEFVAPGSPVVSLLPPGNLKVRFFVPEEDLARLKAGDPVEVAIDGRAPLGATISYLSPESEYTPPVLYNQDNRSKLVYMVEAVFPPGSAAQLHPGQPVDVTPGQK